MNGGHRYNAEKVNRYLPEGVQEKTILFLDTYNGAMYGNALAVFQRALEDERFCDWTFRWTVPDVTEVDDDLQGCRRDPRVELVRATGVGFLHALETSQIIVAGPRLPRYYIKNAGQTVVSVMADDNFRCDPTITEKRAFVQLTLCKADCVFVESDAAMETLEKWYPAGLPFRVVSGQPLRHALRPRASEDVIVSLSKVGLGKTYARMEQRFKSVNMLCARYDKSLYMRIPHEKWLEYREENAPEVLDHVGDDIAPICQDLQNAQILITDRPGDVRQCLEASIPCVFFSNRIDEFYDLAQKNEQRLLFGGDWEEVLDRFGEFLAEGRLAAPDGVRREAALTSVDRLLDAALRSCAGPGSAVERPRRGELFVLLSALDDNVLRAMGYYRPDRDVAVLFTPGGCRGIWNGHRLDERICLMTKFGLCLPDEEGQYTEEILRNEWRRLVGDGEFDRIYAKTTTDEFWQAMYRYAPAKEVVTISRKKLLGRLLQDVENPVLRTLSTETEPPEKTTVAGKSCYLAGRTQTAAYYLPGGRAWDRPALVFVNDPGEVPLIDEYIGTFKKRTVFLIDPKQLMKDSEYLKRKNIFLLPVDKLPVRLFLYAETVTQCRDYAVRRIAKSMGKRVKRLGEVPLPAGPSDRWTLLGITSADEML